MLKKGFIGLFMLTTLLVFVGCSVGQSQEVGKTEKLQASAAAKTSENVEKSTVPTVFIHGYGGTSNSFGGMIQRLTNAGKTQREMVITVQTDGSLQVDGQLSKKKIIQVSKYCF